MLARSGFLHVENIFGLTTQASGFAASHSRADYWDRLLVSRFRYNILLMLRRRLKFFFFFFAITSDNVIIEIT